MRRVLYFVILLVGIQALSHHVDADWMSMSDVAFSMSAGQGTSAPEQTTYPISTSAVIYLPVIARDYVLATYVGDAPDQCPGYPIDTGANYVDDIDASYDNDWYRLTTQEMYVYTIKVTPFERISMSLAVYAPDCVTVLVENDNAPIDPAWGSAVEWTARTAGDLCILIRSYNWQVHGEGTGYSLLVDGTELAYPIITGTQQQGD